jgi:hypothetical protein
MVPPYLGASALGAAVGAGAVFAPAVVGEAAAFVDPGAVAAGACGDDAHETEAKRIARMHAMIRYVALFFKSVVTPH